MTAQSGDVAGGRSVPWALDHPGVAALVSSLAAVAGIVLVVVGLLTWADAGRADLLGDLWNAIPVVVGALMFLVGLPSALGFCGASCVTGRELWGGVVGGFIGVIVTLALVVIMLPVAGLAL